MSGFQNYLLELKMMAFRHLEYDQLLKFFGVNKSDNRKTQYLELRHYLKENTQNYWDNNLVKIENGLIHSGRYEKYMRMLRVVLTLLIGRKTLLRFFDIEDVCEREKLFKRKVKNIRWWLFTTIMLSRTVMSLLFDKAFFKYLDDKFSFSDNFSKKIQYAFTQLPVKENNFLSYILLGNYIGDYLPVYLKKENYNLIKSRVDRIEIITDSCENYFGKLPESTISKFNFSNIFEWIPVDAYDNLLKETIRVARNDSMITYRNLLVFREHSKVFNGQIVLLKPLAKSLHKKDLSFIYDNYVVEQIHKVEV
jgi:S-adenosylmethionine-diacylglycerol 3-amino-3-carboxypropyl transferase